MILLSFLWLLPFLAGSSSFKGSESEQVIQDTKESLLSQLPKKAIERVEQDLLNTKVSKNVNTFTLRMAFLMPADSMILIESLISVSLLRSLSVCTV